MCNIRMPTSTHYYLNFLVLQWVTHAMNLTRYMQAAPLAWSQGVFVRLLCGWWEVTKFVGFSKIWSEDDARALAEPEDQDYYGMGSRTDK
ncbi:unnamed protein product [Durusdinium trenchii]|uniref:Uncharacterized protein n=1 Tax=Durusdinium trenchii TaxID=1381693 RepID=A0ABP0MGD8_9DINO